MTGASREAIYKKALVSAGLSVYDSSETSGYTNNEMLSFLETAYDLAYDNVIQAINWNCCRVIKNFTELSETTKYGYSFVYQVPVDCYRILYNSNQLQSSSGNYTYFSQGYNTNYAPIDFKRIKDKLYTMVELGEVEYIAFIEPNQMSKNFESALVASIAMFLVQRYKTDLVYIKEKEYNLILSKAKSTEGMQAIKGVPTRYSVMDYEGVL